MYFVFVLKISKVHPVCKQNELIKKINVEIEFKEDRDIFWDTALIGEDGWELSAKMDKLALKWSTDSPSVLKERILHLTDTCSVRIEIG